MPAHRYMKDNGSTTMLVTKRSAGVAPDVYLRKCVTHLCRARIRLVTVALKTRGDVTRSPKQGYQTYVLQKLKTKELCINLNFGSLGVGVPHLRREKCTKILQFKGSSHCQLIS